MMMMQEPIQILHESQMRLNERQSHRVPLSPGCQNFLVGPGRTFLVVLLVFEEASENLLCGLALDRVRLAKDPV